jgi:hypothetical protein
VFEEPQDLAADLGGESKQGDGPIGAIGAVVLLRRLGLSASVNSNVGRSPDIRLGSEPDL